MPCKVQELLMGHVTNLQIMLDLLFDIDEL